MGEEADGLYWGKTRMWGNGNSEEDEKYRLEFPRIKEILKLTKQDK